MKKAKMTSLGGTLSIFFLNLIHLNFVFISSQVKEKKEKIQNVLIIFKTLRIFIVPAPRQYYSTSEIVYYTLGTPSISCRQFRCCCHVALDASLLQCLQFNVSNLGAAVMLPRTPRQHEVLQWCNEHHCISSTS